MPLTYHPNKSKSLTPKRWNPEKRGRNHVGSPCARPELPMLICSASCAEDAEVTCKVVGKFEDKRLPKIFST